MGGGDAAALAAALEEAEGRPSGKARLEPAKGGVGPNKATALAVEAARAAKQQAEAVANRWKAQAPMETNYTKQDDR